MRNSDDAVFLNRLNISLRWIIVLGLSVAIASQVRFTATLAIIFLSMAVWNTGLTLAALFNQRFFPNRFLIIGVDLVFANLIFFFSQPLSSSLGWVGLLPVFSAGLFLETGNMVIVAFLSALAIGVQNYFLAQPVEAIIYTGVAAIIFETSGLVIYFLQVWVIAMIRRRQREHLAFKREAARIDQEQHRALYDLISKLSATLDYRLVLDTAIDINPSALATSKEQAGQLVSAVLLIGENGSKETQLVVASARGLPPEDLNVSISGSVGLIGLAIHTGKPHFSKNLSDDPDLVRFVGLRSCRGAYCVPLHSRQDNYGVLLFAHPEAGYFTPERRETFQVIGNQIRIAIHNARSYRDLELGKERMLEFQEEARKKLARQLHDGPTQSVAALAMRVNIARRILEIDPESAVEELSKVEDLARRATKDLRQMLFTLRPLMLESKGLVSALELMADKVSETSSQKVSVEVNLAVISHLDMSRQAVIFFIAEEAVNNARKHSGAKHILVELKSLDSDFALLDVEDNGKGFKLDEVNSSKDERRGMGLINMRDQADLVNGVLEVNSVVGKGTRIRAVIPLSDVPVNRSRDGL